MKTVNCTIRGKTPLLMNRLHIPSLEEMVKPKKGNAKKSELDKFEEKKYIDPVTGKLYQPAVHIYKGLVEMGKQFKVKGQGKATYS